MEPVYMIRGGAFGADFEHKLVMCAIAVVLVAWDLARQKRGDGWRVLLWGTATWTVVELFMQAMGTRVMGPRMLFGFDLPLAVSAPIQGMAEGATIAVFGLFIGDRLVTDRTRNAAAVVFLAVCAFTVGYVLYRSGGVVDSVGAAPSRRNMLTTGSFVFLGVMLAIDVLFLLRWKEYRRRAVAMTFVMLGFATLWTLAEVLAGSRWIEVPGDLPGTYARASALGQFAWLGYDVVIEIALAYVPFFALPAMLKRIKPEPLPVT